MYGNLYLTEKEDGSEFTEEDEELTHLLAAQAAVAIENARLHESSTRWLRQLESLNEIGNALAAQIELEPLLAIVAARLRELVRARLVLIALARRQGRARVAAAEGMGRRSCVGTRLRNGRDSKIGRVLERGRSERVDSVVDDPEVDQRRRGATSSSRTALYVPLIVHGPPSASSQPTTARVTTRGSDEDDLRLGESLAQACGDRRRPLAASQPRCDAPGRRGAGARARAARTRAARRDRAGAHVDPARAPLARAVLESERASRESAACVSSSCRRCTTCDDSPSSYGRRLSTTSASPPALERLVETLR